MSLDALRLLALPIVLVIAATASAAPTALDTFRKTLEKRTDDGDLKRGPCVCLEASMINQIGTIGLLTSIDTGVVTFVAECEVPVFDEATGAALGNTECANWIPLPR